jgi:hypothetical protein
MIYLSNERRFTPKDALDLLERARSLVKDQEIIIRDCRVSRHHIEFDTSLPDHLELDTLLDPLKRISELVNYMPVVEKHMEKDDAIQYARRLFNEEKYWSSHEVLESIWKNSQGIEKDVLNGIILIAAALVHAQKDEDQVCISILKRALAKLMHAHYTYHGIDIDALSAKVSEMVKIGKVEWLTI